MSASREKKARQERGAETLSPKELKEMQEKREAHRSTAIFTVCAVLFAAFVIFTLVNNSGVLKRKAAAASVNGETYSVSDVAYFYYNARASVLNSNSTLDANSSLRKQEYTASDEYDTWFDYVADQAIRTLANVKLTAKAANAEGYRGEDVDATVSETLDSLKTSATNSGYTVAGYIKAVFNGLLSRSVFEKTLRESVTAESYTNAKASPSGYSEAELQAVYDADPTAYSMVDYEAVVFPSSAYATEAAEATDTTPAVEADDGSAAALAAAKDALAAYRKGESLESLANEMGGTYMNTSTVYGTGSDMLEWLFDSARKEGDADVVDYTYYGYAMGSVVVVYHGSSVADYHTVNVRHILVEDEATANSLLEQYRAGAQTEDAFAVLATENSTDTGSSSNGGLYENVYKGQMVEPFEAWCFDASRQPGDTGVVETDYGYHVMYYVGASEYAFWQEMAASKLASDWSASLTENLTTEQLSGMKYIDP